MDQNHSVRIPEWRGCQLREAKKALAERRRRLREAAKANAAESIAPPSLMNRF